MASQGSIEKLYIKRTVQGQPLLVSLPINSNGPAPAETKQVRLPVSVALLEALAALKNLQLEEKHAALVAERVKEIVENYCKNLNLDKIAVDEAVLKIFDEDNEQKNRKVAVNWKAVILKLHESIVENPKAFAALTNIVNPLESKKAEEETVEEEEEEPELKESQVGQSAFAQATSSMAWVGPAPTGAYDKGRTKSPSLFKSSPFIPVKGGKKKKEQLPLQSSQEVPPTRSAEGHSSIIEDSGRSSFTKSFDGVNLTPQTSTLTAALKESGQIQIPTNPLQRRAVSTEGISLKSSFSAAEGPSVPVIVGSLGSDSPISINAPLVGSVNLPPTRLSESAMKNFGLGQSFMYSKAPLVDPLKMRTSLDVSQEISAPVTSLTASASIPADRVQPEEQAVFLEAPHASELMVYPASYFRQKPETTGGKTLALKEATITHESVTLPSWLDFILYWSGAVPKGSDGLSAPLEIVLLAQMSEGHYDYLLQSAISNLIFTAFTSKSKEDLPSELKAIITTHLQAYTPFPSEAKAVAALMQEHSQVVSRTWNAEAYEKFVAELVQARFDFQLEKPLQTLETDLLIHLRANHSSLKWIEKALIALLGHDVSVSREFAVRMLNVLYDGHDWEIEEAMHPVMRYIQDSFVIELDTENYTIDETNVLILVYSPSPAQGRYALSRFAPKVLENGKKIQAKLGAFKAAGYYDWRVVTIDKDGRMNPLVTNTGTQKLSKVQGRVIVHPSVREEIIHEVWAEALESEWDRRTEVLTKKGNFAAVTRSLAEIRNNLRASTLYVMGCWDRTKNSNPFAPTDRAMPSKWLGGTSDFELLVSTAKQMGIKIIVDATARLAARGAHRKYRDLLCYTLDTDTDQLKPHPGTDGRDFRWMDSVMLNYRKKETWDLMVSEIKEWAARGVSGVRLDAAHSWPLILRPNTIELLREDNDGKFHYTHSEIFEGRIVVPATDEATTYGYYGTEASQNYPNPLFSKMTHEIWKEHPNFTFFAEVYWNREPVALNSGIIPYASALSRALASVFDIGIHKDGSITYLPERKNVSALYDWYQRERQRYPQNSMLLYPSASHFLPYPTSVYGAASWAAVDLLFFLPDIPSTYGQEQKGLTVNLDVSKGKWAIPDFDKSLQKSNFSAIQGHYDHRSMMRRSNPVLQDGGMIPLFAYYGGSWHDRVFAFARFTKKQMAIIAINFNDVESVFYVDYSPLKEICDLSPDTIYRVVDFINPTNPPQYYSSAEFLHEKKYVRLGAYASFCYGVYIQAQSPTAQRVLYEHSLARLQRILSNNLDPANNMVYTMLTEGLSNQTTFADSLKKICEQSGIGLEYSLASNLQSILYNVTKSKVDSNTRALAYLKYLSTKGDKGIQSICQQILQQNIMGPIVFITPEIGRFSTVGGVGVMVNELTQALAALGIDIHVISPYYNFNRKGQTGYLEAEGIHWLNNLVTYVGFEHCEVGIHQGKEHGVNLHFLHNFKYFPTPYSTGSPDYQLKQIVLMAKASLELCCQLRLLPSIVVTNDWFAALTPAYAKRSGAFGTTFSGTTFFHLIHNLEEGYEGKIYIDGTDDLGSIHQLQRDLIAETAPGLTILNASKCALLSCDQWGTVSISYKDDLIRTSPLGGLLARFPQPFGKQNGIKLQERLALLKKLAPSHEEAKAMLQKKYFGESDPSIPIFAFIGRIVLQKGVHLILNAVRELVESTRGRIQILIGGMANMKDPYAAQCAWSMEALRRQFPKHFWADPNEFFTDGALVNYGADFGLMPSLFEPSGVVQQEFFAGGTPVICFKTGGLKDSVFEFDASRNSGNGFTFEAHTHGDFVAASQRALSVYFHKDNYAKLRKQARDSVLDVEEVAIAWIREWARLRKRMWAPPGQLDLLQKDIEDGSKSATTTTTPTPSDKS